MTKEYTHFFGEMDLYLEQTDKQIYDNAFRASEDCGYWAEWDGETLKLASQDYDMAEIFFKNHKAISAKRSQDEGKNWETLNFKSNLFEVAQSTLINYNRGIEYEKVVKGMKMPMSQGILIQELIKRYKLHPVAIGYHFDHIGIETGKQFILWRDTGVGAEFMGLINK